MKEIVKNIFLVNDPLVDDLTKYIQNVPDYFIKSKYTGFFILSSVTLIEKCVKDLFVAHATEINGTFGNFIYESFEKMNAKVSYDDIKKDYLSKFDLALINALDKELKRADSKCGYDGRNVSIKIIHKAFVSARNKFAHEGEVLLTFNEALKHYRHSKFFLTLLEKALIQHNK